MAECVVSAGNLGVTARKEDRARMGKVWKGTQLLRICWLLYWITQDPRCILYIYNYIYPMVVGNQYICQTVERALQSANLSIYLNFKESFPLTCCLDSKVHSSAKKGPLSLCKSCT